MHRRAFANLRPDGLCREARHLALRFETSGHVVEERFLIARSLSDEPPFVLEFAFAAGELLTGNFAE
jgi:hypothetical protein